MRSFKLYSLPLIALLVISCSGNLSKNEHQIIIENAIDAPEKWAMETSEHVDTSTRWIESFNDPTMIKLIKEGKANNIDLQIAASNMDKALILAKQSGATLKPTVDLSFGQNQSGSASGGSSVTNNSVGLTASWELDVWGRLRAGANAAEASAQAAEADYIFALHSLSANIAKAYLKVIEAKQQSNISQKNLSILERMMRITQVKYDNGLSSGQDIALNRANLSSAQEQLVAVEASKRDALRALELLLGRYPNASIEIPDILPNLPLAPPAGVPSSVLERRPDIVSAERKIASAFNATEKAKAALLPRFSLTSSVGGASDSLSDVLNPANIVWQLGANLLAPIFDGGKRKLDVELANEEQKQAISNYVKKALTAFSEVESNFDQGSTLAKRKNALNEVFKENNKAYSIAELRYKEGENDLLETLQIQQKTIAAESNLLSIKRLQLEQRINLYLSLGGSW